MRFFGCIQRHPALFCWGSILYMAIFSPACEAIMESRWLHVLIIAPVNLVTWPVAYAVLGNGNWKLLHHSVSRCIFLLPVVSTVLAIAPLFG